MVTTVRWLSINAATSYATKNARIGQIVAAKRMLNADGLFRASSQMRLLNVRRVSL